MFYFVLCDKTRLVCVIDCVSYFVNLIKQKSSPSEQVNVRSASAEAIVASGILEQAKLIGPLVSNHQTTSETTPSNFQNACYVFSVFSVFGHWNEYFQYLSRWVFNTANYTPPPKGSSDLVRRVFDKEIDNHHEEKLLILQFCCPRTLRLLNCICRLPLDGNDKKALFSDMVELGEALKPFLRNPLVANMFRVVVELHEKSLEDLSNVLGGEIWEGFDPYFIFR